MQKIANIGQTRHLQLVRPSLIGPTGSQDLQAITVSLSGRAVQLNKQSGYALLFKQTSPDPRMEFSQHLNPEDEIVTTTTPERLSYVAIESLIAIKEALQSSLQDADFIIDKLVLLYEKASKNQYQLSETEQWRLGEFFHPLLAIGLPDKRYWPTSSNPKGLTSQLEELLITKSILPEYVSWRTRLGCEISCTPRPPIIHSQSISELGPSLLYTNFVLPQYFGQIEYSI
jgi:hypothetical protein